MFKNEPVTIAQYRNFRCFELAGTHLDLHGSGSELSAVTFVDGETLCVSIDGEDLFSSCHTVKIADDAFFVHTELPETQFRRGLSFVYDAAGGAVTVVSAVQGHIRDCPRRVEHKILFAHTGAQDTRGGTARPHYTDILVGKQIEYTYSEGFAVRHRYLSEHAFEWEITKERDFPQFAGQPHTEYCDAVWLREELLLFSWLEAESGTQGAFALNTNHMRTAGAFFGIGPDGMPESYTMGAFAALL